MHRSSLSRIAVLASALLASIALASVARGQRPEANYDEARVGTFALPELLTTLDGARVTDRAAWEQKRRPELLQLFASHVYGRTPADRANESESALAVDPEALGGRAVREQVTLRFGAGGRSLSVAVLVYRPAGAKGKVPAFLGLNFGGNHAVHPDPGIGITRSWMRDGPGVVSNRATEAGRGLEKSRWPVERIVKRGYALVTAYYGDIDPDFDDGFANGVHPLFYRPGQTRPEPDEWGSIGAWAWGLSRVLDWLERRSAIDSARVALVGHSRLGKAALWAGAQDPRFALVVSNESGEGGAALARRNYGETVADLNRAFPHWFAGNYKRYSNDVASLPVDQHMLLALVAPRPLYVASAVEDRWADPRGEFLAAQAAEPAWTLYGLPGLAAAAMPAPGKPVGRTIGYHLRTGAHDVTEWDWERFLDFADRQLPKSRE
jgi:dienelactone hydrolase